MYCFGGANGTASSAQWHIFTGVASSCLPYYSGALVSVDGVLVLQNADLHGLSGSKIYLGAGLSDAQSPAGTASTA